MIALGAYPSDPYFDPSRPSWVPFWIDTPTESAVKWGLYPGVKMTREYPDPPAPPAAPSPGQSSTDQWADYRARTVEFYGGVDAETERLRAAADESSRFNWGLVFGAAILIGGVILAGRL